jgi:hypothetical protein
MRSFAIRVCKTPLSSSTPSTDRLFRSHLARSNVTEKIGRAASILIPIRTTIDKQIVKPNKSKSFLNKPII